LSDEKAASFASTFTLVGRLFVLLLITNFPIILQLHDLQGVSHVELEAFEISGGLTAVATIFDGGPQRGSPQLLTM
jgi:hypothetical protein